MSWFHFDGKRKLERTAESSSRTFYTEGDILRQFRSENWSKLDTNSRLDVLNAYEQLRASRIGRKPAVIQQMQHIPANEGIAGKTLDGGRQIEIDLDMLSSYETLDTLIHESTHVEQFDACANNRTVNYSAESLNRFRAETVDYCADSPDYDRQCLELDANNCAAEFMMSKADVFADDPKYFSYLQERKAHFKNINRDLQDNETERRQLQERQVSNAYRFGRISEQQYQDNLKAVREQHPEEAVQDSLRMTDELNYTTEYVEENLCRRNASITEQMVQQAEQQHEQMTDSQQRNTISEKQYQILSRENQQQLENLQGHRQQLKELQQWQYDQLKEYVIENGMSRVNTENDEKYQQMAARYRQTQDQLHDLDLQTEILNEDQKQLDEATDYQFTFEQEPPNAQNKEVNVSEDKGFAKNQILQTSLEQDFGLHRQNSLANDKEERQDSEEDLSMDELSEEPGAIEEQEASEEENLSMDELSEEPGAIEEQETSEEEGLSMDELGEEPGAIEEQESSEEEDLSMDDMGEEPGAIEEQKASEEEGLSMDELCEGPEAAEEQETSKEENLSMGDLTKEPETVEPDATQEEEKSKDYSYAY